MSMSYNFDDRQQFILNHPVHVVIFKDLECYRLLLDGCPLIAIHKARYYKCQDGLALGPGPFIEGLEYAADVKATVVGKPEKTFFLEALKLMDCKPEEAVMIGDVSLVSNLQLQQFAKVRLILSFVVIVCQHFQRLLRYIESQYFNTAWCAQNA